MENLRLVPCGDRTLLCYLGERIDPAVNDRVHAVARALREAAHPAVVEIVPAFSALMVEFDPVRIRPEQVEQLVRRALARTSGAPAAPRTVEIPVAYGGDFGPDLDAVAAHTGLPPHEVIARHSGAEYRVFCLGFSPGFPYLGGLDPALHTPRLKEPRVRVPAGSVGIGGEQTGVYPSESPGGWQLIGRTPIPLFDPLREEPALLHPGDRVRFVPVDPVRFEELAVASRRTAPPPVFEPGRTGIRILQPGLMTTIQDLGRRGYAAYGLPLAGAADPGALMVGNWLLANRARTAALEITVLGPEIEFTGPAAFALTGAPAPAELIPADGSSPRPVPYWSTHLAAPGDRLRIGAAPTGCRSYLCVAGGIDLPPVLGSLSEDLFGKIGPLGRPLRTGDWLPIGLPLHPPAYLAGRAVPPDAIPAYEGRATIRATRGPQDGAFTPDALAAFFSEEYRVGNDSNRQGLRLEGARLSHAGPADIVSEPVPPGSVQVPASGLPILLLSNRQTMGGYTKIAVSVFTDVWVAAQLRPGDRIRFREVDAAEAHAIAWQERRRLGQIRRYLERERGAQNPAPPVPAGPGRGPVRTFVVRIGGIEFRCEVEEVTDR